VARWRQWTSFLLLRLFATASRPLSHSQSKPRKRPLVNLALSVMLRTRRTRDGQFVGLPFWSMIRFHVPSGGTWRLFRNSIAQSRSYAERLSHRPVNFRFVFISFPSVGAISCLETSSASLPSPISSAVHPLSARGPQRSSFGAWMF
jgi:hypothetical protein